ncbi:MAG TPA: lysophospholipid acyltransferase family protein [Bdellovibrionales bacterium]|nr:lysophospholipid acyltransferase family protein [Bdellovibrionales bacterium]
MKNFFEKPKQRLFGLKDLPRDVLLYRVMPHFFLEVIRKYFRMTVEGAEHIPKKGPAIILPNHSGYSGFDAVLLAHEIVKASERIPRVLTHHLWFVNQATALPAQKMGFVEATTKNGLDLLKKKNLVVLFPEGEYGNFKPTTQRYRLQEFKRGFVRMALQTQAPIIPTLIIGAEETHINLRQLKFTKYLIGSVLPLPLNVIPLPVKWHIHFLEPIYFPYKPQAANDPELVRELASDVRERMQKTLNKELAKRSYL